MRCIKSDGGKWTQKDEPEWRSNHLFLNTGREHNFKG
jgi:hypothetical protein